MGKAFKLGIIVGRFQTFHKGHQEITDKAVALCDEVGVFIGSSQESGTNKNPFTYEMRESFFKKIYGDAVKVFPLPDIGVGNNSKWGDYVLENTVKCFGKYPDILVSGKEGRRIDWFDSIHGLAVAELYVPKTIEISACKMRELIIQNDFDTWKSFSDERLWDSFDDMRALVEKSYKNEETASI